MGYQIFYILQIMMQMTIHYQPLMLSIGDFFIKRFGAGDFKNENLWPAHIGQFLILLSFFASILATITYIFAAFSK